MKAIGWLLIALGLVGLPLLGVAVKGEPFARYTEFPPLTRYVQHAPFSWVGFFVFAAAALLFFGPLVSYLHRAWQLRPRESWRGHFPWWGWLGLLEGTAAWVLAWTRFEWFAPWQRYTFSPQWIGYILVVNALTYWRNRNCLMTRRPGFFLALFPVSAVFWWYFEYLNRFVQNWYYVGLEGVTGAQYFWLATLPFATVLPAVWSTAEFLDVSLGRPNAVLAISSPQWWTPARAGAIAALCALGMAMISLWPDGLFPLLWVAPIFILGLPRLLLRRSLLDGASDADVTHRMALYATAALICGFFWEFWNYYSLAKWKYSVPFVQRFLVFEMPILGFTGYLPFGIECALVGDYVGNAIRRFSHGRKQDQRKSG